MYKSPQWATFIDANAANGIEMAISAARLSRYGLLPTPNNIAAVAEHGRNIVLCEALYPTLHMLEVVMRNSIHNSFALHYGAPDWYDKGWLLHGHIALIADAKAELAKKNKPIPADRVVAELTFGFWCGMFNHAYETARGPWPTLLTATLPRVPKSWRTRQKVKDRVERARYIRNRVFHHECISHLRDLRDRHRELVELLGWFSADARSHAQNLCRFGATLTDRLIA